MLFNSKLKTFVFSILIWAVVLTSAYSAEIADNLTEADNDDEAAEFRQGGIAQQLMSSYPAMSVGNLYGGNTGGYQYMTGASGASGAGAAGQGYVNMLRNLYRPPSFGLTDKVRHWVKSFMNRRQYVKPYYNPSIGGMSYAPSEYGSKPMFAANGYKAISVPLRQLQKYYKPYYGTSEGANGQYAGASAPGSASASSFVNYSPNGVASNGGGLYASETANAGQFSGGNGGLYGSPSEGASGLFGGAGGANGGNIFSSGNSPSSGIFSSGGASSGIFSQQGGQSGIFSSNDGSSGGLYGGAGSLYGASGSPSSGLYHGSSGGAFSLDGSSYGGSDSNSQFFGASNGGGYGSSAAASSILASLNGGGSSGGSYGDLFASGANPAPSLYNPSSGDNGRGYGGNSNKKPNYGASNTALYMSSDDRNSESYPSSQSGKENSFNVDSSRNNQAEASYSVSFGQPAQSKSYSAAAFENAGFQPVAYSPESAGSSSFQEKSS